LLGLLVTGCGGGSYGNNNSNNPLPPPPPPVTVGLDARPDNTTCIAPARATLGTIDVTNAFPGLTLSLPTKILVEPVANPRWFALEKNGRVVTFDPDNVASLTPFLDLTGTASTSANEGGLLGMAFHPDYPTVAEVFLSYTVEGTGGARLHSRVTRFILDDVNSPGAGTVQQQIIEIDQFASNTMAARSRSARTACCISVLAMAAAEATRMRLRRTRQTCWGRCYDSM
jgi:hypothetical protein